MILITITLGFECFHKIFEGELLVMFGKTFLFQIFSPKMLFLKDFTDIVRLHLAAVSINGLTH